LKQGCSPKKKWGAPERRLRQRFLNNLGLHTCCTEIILHCVSVSNELQQWTNFCTNFSPKSGGVGDESPCRKKWGGSRPLASPPHYTPAFLGVKQSTLAQNGHTNNQNYRVGPKNRTVFRLDNFVTVSPRKACSMSKFSKFYREKKVQNPQFSEFKYSLPNLLKSSQHVKLWYI